VLVDGTVLVDFEKVGFTQYVFPTLTHHLQIVPPAPGSPRKKTKCRTQHDTPQGAQFLNNIAAQTSGKRPCLCN
jgi:hypothetical protein